MSKAPNNNWWRGGVIYQIYPRSFADSNGDGVGDLPGITKHLDYVAKLGADAVWLSPIFKSPMKDFGYDVSDYCDVDPLFGTLDDFRTMVNKAHDLGLRVMIDQVLSHTSDQHPWFAESRASRNNPKADWYVWADAKDDGNPPNNWLSIFGGSAWQWDTRRRQYYLHNFLTSQPDLNYHNPDVVEAILGTVKFWLELGVDGYRLDTANYYFHDKQLRDNPGRGQPKGNDPAVNDVNPYGWQYHKFDKTQPENLGFLKQLRALLDQYPNTTMVGEIGDDDGLTVMAEYTSGTDKLHMAYSFDLLGPDSSSTYLHDLMTRFAEKNATGWPSWALSNHDVVRVGSRWGGESADVRKLRVAAAFQMCLRGSPCLYQGDELGLPEAQVAYEDLQDPYGITMWPEFKGRDGCRTPMPWDGKAADMGFGSGTQKPWLPLTEAYRRLAVSEQDKDPQSLLNFYRGLLAWRKGQDVLLHGDQALLPAHKQVMAFVREHEGKKVLCAFNFSDSTATMDLPAEFKSASALHVPGLSGGSVAGDTIKLETYGALLLVI
ncbi:MAG: Oligo,6-glucosidase 1 [Pseudomonadota bacterium]